ncbi:hypothetical protein CXG81DRAFT_28583 [Caulochytrium protostelioides]|uniref:Uncharacterized protein n=1 Tax=Caulochytrium protostelioides TaxID=1555241 RepID=A0A4P9WYK7_9FUNG|nr:hypothetical protein CXG81DRAFT_28583 [Caulochytrium protostelioides]|eukprot:RKO98609.1 hypothetical protein CXG81DRAFT_28583 [Caulochytrium protostelioides]
MTSPSDIPESVLRHWVLATCEHAIREPYHPEKVALRTELTYQAARTNGPAERAQRRHLVATTGFLAASREPYQYLGEPVLNIKDLIATCVRRPASHEKQAARGVAAAYGDGATRLPEVAAAPATPLRHAAPRGGRGEAAWPRGSEGPVRTPVAGSALDSDETDAIHKTLLKTPGYVATGYHQSRDAIARSLMRVHATRLGASYADILRNSATQKKYHTRLVTVADGDKAVRWAHFDLSEERQAYWLNLYDRKRREWEHELQMRSDAAAVDTAAAALDRTDRTLSPSHSPSPSPSPGSSPRRGAAGTGRPGHAEPDRQAELLAARPPSPPAPQAARHDPPKPTIQQLASALQIKPPNSARAKQAYLTTKGQLSQARQRMTTILLDELDRTDLDRQVTFERRFAALHTTPTSSLRHDLGIMRQTTEAETRAWRERNLRDHPWWHHLLSKTVHVGGVKREISNHEATLMNTIQEFIELNIDFSPAVLAQLLHVVPADALPTEDIQRILRYIKGVLKITERDWLKVIAASGHRL